MSKDFSSTTPNISTYSPLQSPTKSNHFVNTSNFHTEKSMDIFIPNLKELSAGPTPTKARRNTTIDSPTYVRQPNSSTGSPKSYFPSPRHSPKTVRKFNDANINNNEIANFNRDLAKNLDIYRLKDIYDKEEVPFIDLNYLIDNDEICRINSKETVPNRDPSENILLKHNIPQVSMDQREQIKFLVQVIHDAVSHTREINQYCNQSLDLSYLGNESSIVDSDVDLTNVNFTQMKCEMDIWLSTLNECVKVIGTRLKPISLIILVIQRELKKNFKQLVAATDAQSEIIAQLQQGRDVSASSNASNALNKSSSSLLVSQLSANNLSESGNQSEASPMVGVLKRDVERLQERITSLNCQLISVQSELKHKEKSCEKLLDVNHHLRQTISDAERKIAAFSVKTTEVGASGLGHVPDAAQVVWGELSSFAKDMTKALKKVNMDLLLPESAASVAQPKLALSSASSPTANFSSRRLRRKSYSSSVQTSLLFDFDIYSLANSGNDENKKENLKASAGNQVSFQAGQNAQKMEALPIRPQDSVRRVNTTPSMAPPKLNGGDLDAFPKAPTMAPPKENGGDAFPRAPSMAPPKENGGDAFPKAPSMAPPKSNNGDSDAFPRAPSMAPPKENKPDSDAFPKAPTMAPPKENGGGDAFPRVPTMAPPKENSDSDAFPKAPTMAPPKENSGGDSFPRAPSMAPPKAGGNDSDAFPKAPSMFPSFSAFPPSNKPSVSIPKMSNADSFPRANVAGSISPKPVIAATPFSNLGSSAGAPASVQKRVRAPTKPDKKLHFSNFFPVMCNFTDTCSGNLLAKPPSSIYTQLESELRAFLVQIFQKYKERMASVRGEIEKMNDKFNAQIAGMKERSASRAFWARTLFHEEELLTLPKDVKVPDDYQSTTLPEIARAIVAIMRPQFSESFAKMMSINIVENNQNQNNNNNNNNGALSVRPSTASDALYDSFAPQMTLNMINFIAFVNKFAKTDITIDMFRLFFAGEFPFTHFIFFCQLFISSQNIASEEAQPRIDALARMFDKYGYSTKFPQNVRASLEEQYCGTYSSFIVLAMSLYSHIIAKLSKKVDDEMTEKPSAPSSPSKISGSGSVSFGAKFARSSLGKQQFLTNFVRDNVIAYVEEEKPPQKENGEEESGSDDEDDAKKKKKAKVEEKQTVVLTPEKEIENKNAVEYMRAIAGRTKDLSAVEVAVEMFNYSIPHEESLEDFDPQTQEFLVYMTAFGEKGGKKGKKSKDKTKKVLEPIKCGELIPK